MATDTFYYPSGGESVFFSKLDELTRKWPHEIRHYLDLFPVYSSRRSFIRQLAHYELFKLTVDLPGHYVDFGVYFGKSSTNMRQASGPARRSHGTNSPATGRLKNPCRDFPGQTHLEPGL